MRRWSWILDVLQRVTEEHFFDGISALVLEEVRKELRGIVKLLVASRRGRAIICTSLADPAGPSDVREDMIADDDYEDYELKVNRYLVDYADNPVIQKLHRNEALSDADFIELERIFTQELGSADDYSQAYGETPFGLLVRSIVKLDHEAVMQAFADFLNDEGLGDQQMAFVHKVIDYIETNGYMEPQALAQAPFDRPQSFAHLFDRARQMSLVRIINEIKGHAVEPAA